MSETAVHEARTATSCTCTEIQEMSSATETTVHRTARHSTAAGLPRDPREAGDEISHGADGGIRTETDRGIETGSKTDTESDARGTGAETEMMIGEGIADVVKRENMAGIQRDTSTENKEIGREAIAVTREAKEKQSTSVCLKGKRSPRKKLKAMRLKTETHANTVIAQGMQNKSVWHPFSLPLFSSHHWINFV